MQKKKKKTKKLKFKTGKLFMQQVFLKKDTQVNLIKILKTLSPALFLDSLEFEGQLNWNQ